MELTKEQKKKVMERVLNRILDHQKRNSCVAYICNFTKEAIIKLEYSPKETRFKVNIFKLIPELLKYKPKHVIDRTDAWWSDKDSSFDYDSRIKVVEALIKEYSE